MRGWVALALCGVTAVAYIAHRRSVDSRLLRADPDHLPASWQILDPAAAAGAAVFRGRCVNCHREHGAGDSVRGVPNLADSDWLYGSGSVSDIERVVTYGIRSNHPKAWNLAQMPAYARPHPSSTNPQILSLPPRAIDDVVEYLFSVQKRPADAAAARRGAQIYSTVGGCYDCHSPDAQGDSAIGAPNLVDGITLYGDGGRASLFASIADGRQGVCPAWIGTLTPVAIREVAVYVYELSHGPEPSHAPEPWHAPATWRAPETRRR